MTYHPQRRGGAERRGIDYDEDVDECYPREFRQFFRMNDSIYPIPRQGSKLADIAGQSWPQCVLPESCDAPSSPKEAFLREVAEAWKCSVEDLTEWDEDDREVGEVNGISVLHTVKLLRSEVVNS